MSTMIAASGLTKGVLTDLERQTIRGFVERHRSRLTGRVLDFGCGMESTCVRSQPYRDLVAGEYVGYDTVGYPFPSGRFDTVLCTQVLQYLKDPFNDLRYFRKSADCLVLTYPTHWPEVERSDRQRFTRQGMAALVEEAGFRIVEHDLRWAIQFDDFYMAGGYGLVAE